MVTIEAKNAMIPRSEIKKKTKTYCKLVAVQIELVRRNSWVHPSGFSGGLSIVSPPRLELCMPLLVLAGVTDNHTHRVDVILIPGLWVDRCLVLLTRSHILEELCAVFFGHLPVSISLRRSFLRR